MRVLRVISTLSAAAGGPVEGLIQQYIELSAGGHDVYTACADRPGMPVDERLPINKVFQLGPSHLKYGYTSRMRSWLRKNLLQFDVLIIHGIWNYHSYCAASEARRLGVPYVVFLHGMLDPWFARTFPLKHLKKWLYWPWAEYRVLRDARLVLFTSAEELRLARESFWLYRVRERLVGYGIRPPDEDPFIARANFLERFPKLANTRNLLYLSRIHPKKGCDLLIRAFSKIAKRDPNFHLVLAGPGEEAWVIELQRMVEENSLEGQVTFTGMLRGRLKWGAYDCAEVFVLPSHQENFGIVVAEALARGVPVLTTDKVNIWREIQSANAGLVRPDSQAGADQMLEDWIALEPDQKESMRRNARRCFAEEFDIRTVTGNLLSALEDAVHKPAEQYSYVGSPRRLFAQSQATS